MNLEMLYDANDNPPPLNGEGDDDEDDEGDDVDDGENNAEYGEK